MGVHDVTHTQMLLRGDNHLRSTEAIDLQIKLLVQGHSEVSCQGNVRQAATGHNTKCPKIRWRSLLVKEAREKELVKATLGPILQPSSIWKTSSHSSAQPLPWKVYILFLYTVTRTKKGKEYLRWTRTSVPPPPNSGSLLQTPMVTWFSVLILRDMAVWIYDILVMQSHHLSLLTPYPYPFLPVKALENKQNNLYSQGRLEVSPSL